MFQSFRGKTFSQVFSKLRSSVRRRNARRRFGAESLEARTMLAAGGLDPTFGSGGFVTTPVGSDGSATKVLVEPDGKIVAAGSATVGGRNEFTLIRYNADGSLDTTFGTAGVVTTAIGVGSSQIYGLALQSDGDIVAVGNSFDRSRLNFTLARYNDDGTLDAGFGQGGIVTAPVGISEAEAFAVAIQPDGRIVVGGNASQQFTLARYLANGSLDPSFGTGGVDTLTTVPGNAAFGGASGVAIEPDGKIVAVGGGVDFSMVRVNGDGSLDQSFGTNGFVKFAVGGSWYSQSVAIQPDGKILVGGTDTTQIVWRSPPPPPPGAVSLPIETQDPAYDWFGLQRFNADGSLDSSFGNGGVVITKVGGGGDSLSGLSLEPDGRIVAGGRAELDPDGSDAQSVFAAAIFNSDGTLDTGFADGGVFVSPSGATQGGGLTSTIDSQGRILIAGAAGSDGQHLDFAVARVTTDSTSRTIFATEGVNSGSQVVASFTDPSNPPVTDYSAEINWGDGTSSTGTVSFDAGSGVYSVSGSHAYTEDGSDLIVVTVHRTGAPDVTLDAIAAVVEPPLVQIFPPVVAPLGHEGTALTVTVGYFTHGNNTETGTPPPGSEGAFVGELSAMIDWGDGTTSAGRVDGNGSNYVVTGTHTYQDEGHYSVKATVLDISGDDTLTLGTTVSIREALLPDGAEATANQRLISEVYGDLLHRNVDTSGLAYWSAQLDGGATRIQLVAGIENSDEYRHDEINGLFEKYLHRQADAGSLSDFESLLAHGATDETIAAMVVGSDEYFTARGGGTTDGFLDTLFEDALNRPIDSAAKTAFEQFLAHGMTREQAAAVVFGSAEYRHDLVAQVYLDTLDRPIDANAQTYWAAKLADGWTDEQVVAGLAASDEYFAKIL